MKWEALRQRIKIAEGNAHKAWAISIRYFVTQGRSVQTVYWKRRAIGHAEAAEVFKRRLAWLEAMDEEKSA